MRHETYNKKNKYLGKYVLNRYDRLKKLNNIKNNGNEIKQNTETETNILI